MPDVQTEVVWRPTNKMATPTFLLRFVVATVTINVVCGGFNRQPPLPTIDLDEWWGPGNAMDQDTSIRSFKIKFEPSMITDLKHRLKNHRPFVPSLEGVGIPSGATTPTHEQLEVWMEYLREQYPFKQRETFLNKYSHYTTYIQGLRIHFIREKSKNIKGKTVIPLLLVHGWPGSVREFYEAIPYLLKNAEAKGLALDIIVPSLPGFAFSDGAVRAGMGVDKVAVILRNLMHRCGHPRFVAQGGDMGGITTMNLVTLFPDEIIGYHTNFPLIYTPEMIFRLILGNLHKDEIVEPHLQSRVYPSWKKFLDIVIFTGYLHMQATKPDTYGVLYSDSPAGLMSSNLRTIGLPNNTGTVPADNLLDNFMIYWSTNCAITAMRLYADTFNKRYVGLRINEIKTPVPTWTLQAPKEHIYVPPWLLKLKFPNLLGNTVPTEGGHFYAFENPKEFAEDVVKAIVAFREWNAMNRTLYDECLTYITN